MTLRKKFSKAGFTLIELLVVIAIIGVLATLVVANFSSSRARARDVRRKNDFRQIKSALRLYYNDYQAYPANSGSQIQGCGTSGTSTCSWGGSFSGTEEYMKSLPTDPLNAGNNVYEYTQTNSGQGFTLSTELENPSDQDAAQSQSRCGVSLGAQYYVVCED